MAVLAAHGIAAELPSGLEGRIYLRPAPTAGLSRPVAQFASFALPKVVGDFGGGAVTVMGADDLFCVLFEYGPESVGTALFARTGMPRTLSAEHFLPYLLRRGRPGHAGTQWFFTEGGRPFTLYVVLGSHRGRHRLVPRVNALLGAVSVDPVTSRPAPWN
jgi:hypothetical protein